MTSTRNPTRITAEPGTPFLDLEREFDAPVTQVFRAWVEPDLIVQWLGPRNRSMRLETWDPRTGGSYAYTHYTEAEEFEAHFRGMFHTVDTDRLIVQTFEFASAPDEVCLDFGRFEDLGDGRTRFVTRSVFPSAEARDAALNSGMSEGVTQSFERLSELLAAG